MAEKKEFIDAADVDKKRPIKLTERVLEDKLHRLIRSRKAVLAKITGKTREIENLMSDDDNLQKVQKCMDDDFCSMVTELEDVTYQMWDLLSEEEKNADKTSWVEPKMQTVAQFAKDVEKWMDAVNKSKKEKEHLSATVDVNDDVTPEDSASQVSVKPSHICHILQNIISSCYSRSKVSWTCRTCCSFESEARA